MQKEDKRLGRGLEALLPSVEESPKRAEETSKATVPALGEEKLRELAESVKKNPRLVIWSPKALLALKILKNTVPNFSISGEASKLLEEAIRSKYPEAWKSAEELIR